MGVLMYFNVSNQLSHLFGPVVEGGNAVISFFSSDTKRTPPPFDGTGLCEGMRFFITLTEML
jgi:hypothetical protein